MDGIVCVVLLYEGTALCCILQLSLLTLARSSLSLRFVRGLNRKNGELFLNGYQHRRDPRPCVQQERAKGQRWAKMGRQEKHQAQCSNSYRPPIASTFRVVQKVPSMSHKQATQ
jgi:hypothetical protein